MNIIHIWIQILSKYLINHIPFLELRCDQILQPLPLPSSLPLHSTASGQFFIILHQTRTDHHPLATFNDLSMPNAYHPPWITAWDLLQGFIRSSQPSFFDDNTSSIVDHFHDPTSNICSSHYDAAKVVVVAIIVLPLWWVIIYLFISSTAVNVEVANTTAFLCGFCHLVVMYPYLSFLMFDFFFFVILFSLSVLSVFASWRLLLI